jgi:hypothetical protein
MQKTRLLELHKLNKIEYIYRVSKKNATEIQQTVCITNLTKTV